MSRPAAIAVCALLVVADLSVIAMTENVTLEGTIDAAEYNEDGEGAAVAIYDSEWGTVLISNEGAAQPGAEPGHDESYNW